MVSTLGELWDGQKGDRRVEKRFRKRKHKKEKRETVANGAVGEPDLEKCFFDHRGSHLLLPQLLDLVHLVKTDRKRLHTLSRQNLLYPRFWPLRFFFKSFDSAFRGPPGLSNPKKF
jgi:hypothetical protein